MRKTYIFVGNRFNVLESMIKKRLKVVLILVVRGSYLEHELKRRRIKHRRIIDQNFLIKQIQKTDFDFLVSNGCPFILPISTIKKSGQEFINIHPSLLPDLRGKNPINGSILFNRAAGATCHIMDDGIDTGKIISQISIGRIHNLELLYQLSFNAEAKVFCEALKRSFKPGKGLAPIKSPIYYTRKEGDMIISLEAPLNKIIRQIRAFAVEEQGAYFFYNGMKIKVLDVEIIKNESLKKYIRRFDSNTIIYQFRNSILMKIHNQPVLLKGIQCIQVS